MNNAFPYTSSQILITGGTGFLASYLIDELQKNQANRIIALDRLESKDKTHLAKIDSHPKIELIDGDIRDKLLVDRLMAETDYCVHLAALKVNACRLDPSDAFDVMARGTLNVIEAAAKYKVKKLIYASSATIYGQAAKIPTPETEPPYDNRTFYGALKLLGEQMLRSYHYTHQLPFVALRFFNIYGPGMDCSERDSEVFIRWLKAIETGSKPKIFGDSNTTADFVFVHDVARAVILALESAHVDEVFNIGTGKEIPLTGLLEKIMHLADKNIETEYVPQVWFNPVSRRSADTRKAEKGLGFSAEVSIDEGLRQLVDWYRRRT